MTDVVDTIDQNTTGEYGASSITVLEGLAAVRKRPGMYIGSTGERGLHHLVYEIVDNSVDEAMAGHATGIDVTLLADGGIRVIDDGRGIPVDVHAGTGKPAVEVVMTVLHAGGKFGDGGYKVSGGLHGVGISVVNALSYKVDVQIKRDGKLHAISFGNGGEVTAALEVIGEAEGTGTTVTFWADPSIFTESTRYDFETLRTSFQQRTFLNKGLRIKLTDEREAGENGDFRSVEYCYANGLVDYVTHLNTLKENKPIHDSVIAISAAGDDIAVEVAAQWTTSYNTHLYSFANTINTHEGGTHEEGFRTALTGLINRYAREKGYLKEKEPNLEGADIREGLTAIISIKIAEPQFEGQTKTKLGNSEAKSFVQRVTNEMFADWLDSHPGEAKDIIVKAQSAAKARAAARKAREASRKTAMSGSSMPGKLKDCTSRNPEDSEIYIVEGDSAGGSASEGRDPQTQAILPIRGKILNVEKASLDRALGSSEIDALITAFGCGFGEEFNIDKLRYHKIVLMADADVDGQHIATLLLTLLFRYQRPLIEGGHVYLAQPPLYKIKWDKKGDNVSYAYSDDERDAVIAEGVAAGKRDPRGNDGIQRYKGLGEMDAPELWETTMDPDNRILLQINLDDAMVADEMFSILMGESVPPRKAYITNNASRATDIDI